MYIHDAARMRTGRSPSPAAGVPPTGRRPARRQQRQRRRQGWAGPVPTMALAAGGAVLLLLLLLAMLVAVEAKASPWGKSAVFRKGKWVPFDEADEAGVPQPYPPKTDSWKGNDTTIMVSISSFRDFRCPKTLYNLFT